MQASTNCYWYQHPQQQVITMPKHTTILPLLGVIAITDIHDISKSICIRTQEKNSYQDILFF